MPDFEELLKEYVIPLGWIRDESFTEKENLTYAANYPELQKLGKQFPGELDDKWKPADMAMVMNHNLKEAFGRAAKE